MRAPFARCLMVALTALLLVGPTAGCAGFNAFTKMDRVDDFEIAHLHFTQYVRFGRIAKAAKFVNDDQLEDFLALEPQLNDFRLTDYEVVAIDLDDEAKSATVDVRFSGYIVSEMVERNVDSTQHWSHDEESGDWKVELEIASIRRGLASGR